MNGVKRTVWRESVLLRRETSMDWCESLPFWLENREKRRETVPK
ncbi:hypothetical protein [Bacillus marinisedimentorum]|nr:hypothetical protein [Bacillus marinisedimentorum]